MLEPGHIYHLDCLAGMRQLEDASVDLVLTDPPYNLGNDGVMFHCGLERDAEVARWDHVDNAAWLDQAIRVLRPSGTIIAFGSHHNIFEIGHILRSRGAKILNTIVMMKRNGFSVTRRQLLERTQYAVWASPSGSGWHYDFALMKRLNGDREPDNVWLCEPPRTGRVHPTQKPLEVIERLVLLASRPSDLVLDPFMGSGTTALACTRHGRRFVGFETDERYVVSANDRLRQLDWIGGATVAGSG